jgi:hypothetical protein
MPSIVGPCEPLHDPRQRPETWQVPLAAVGRDARVLDVVCKRCQRQRRWSVDRLVARYGGKRLVRDLWIRWRCSRCGSSDCLVSKRRSSPYEA